MEQNRGQSCIARMVCLLILVAVPGCSSLQLLDEKPVVKDVLVTVVGLDFRKMDLRFDVQVDNAGSGMLTVLGYDYDLHIEGQPFLKGESAAGFELKPHAVTAIPVPISIKFSDLVKKTSSLLGRSEVVYRIAVGLTVATPAGSFRLPFQKEGRLPLRAGAKQP